MLNIHLPFAPSYKTNKPLGSFVVLLRVAGCSSIGGEEEQLGKGFEKVKEWE